MSTTAVILIIVAAVVLLVLISLIGRAKPKCIDKQYFKNEWADIIALQKDYKTRPMCLIKADKLLDEALKGSGYHGETMAERLVSAKNHLKDRDRVWAAHKLRNKLVHESLFEPSEKEVKLALEHYRKAFKDLGVF
ncbi:MAG TPA: hypothetical protein VMR51_01755 [Patescibacteria group bacterium]|nr:hypothetical protein [Patescibacteria group bacterium]